MKGHQLLMGITGGRFATKELYDLSPESGDNMVKFFLEWLFHVRLIIK